MTADSEGPGAGDGDRLRLTRRQFLGYTGAGGALMVLGDALLLGALGAPDKVAAVPVTMTRTARRREDFVSLTFEFRNLVLTGTSPRRLIKANTKQAAYLVAVFPPQHLADEARILSELKTAGDTEARLAGPTRLAFEVAGELLPMPFDMESLLRWPLFPLRVPPVAGDTVPSSVDLLTAPAPDQTAIELPWFLLLSPRSDAGWAHAVAPVTRGSRTELWHTRLGTRKPGGFFGFPIVDEHDDANRTVRAIWAGDANFPDVASEPESAPKFSLTALQRRDIVRATSVGSARKPVQVNRMMLSALGGWLDSRGLGPSRGCPSRSGCTARSWAGTASSAWSSAAS